MFSGAAGTSSASLGWPQPPAAGRHLSLPRLEHLLIHYFIFYLIFLPTPLGCHTRTHWKASLGWNIPQSLTAGTHLSIPRLEHTTAAQPPRLEHTSASHGWNPPVTLSRVLTLPRLEHTERLGPSFNFPLTGTLNLTRLDTPKRNCRI